MLELKIRKIGNSLGVVLPKEAVSRLQAGEGDRLFLIEGPNGAYQLTPYDPAFEKKMKQAEDIVGRYRTSGRARHRPAPIRPCPAAANLRLWR